MTLIERLRDTARCFVPPNELMHEAADALEQAQADLSEHNRYANELSLELMDARAEIERLQKLLDAEMDSNHKLAAKELELQARVERLEAALEDVDRWLALFIAAWDKSRDKKKPSEAPVALMEAIRQHSVVKEALAAEDER